MGCLIGGLLQVVSDLMGFVFIETIDKKIIMPIQDGFSRRRLRLRRERRQKERGE